MNERGYCTLCCYAISSVDKETEVMFGLQICGDCLPGARRLLLASFAHINADAEAAMLRTGEITGAHHRAIEAEQKRLGKQA
jgi:hypothetical protein